MGTRVSVPQILSSQPQIAETVLATPCLPARYARFGKFQIDTERQELFQDGQRVRMQAKVYQTLLLLVSRAGDIVTREEVGRRLWPDRLPLGLDANVNTAMNKLRQGLGDSTEKPVYIETIPRRGYCFIAPLEFSDIAAPTATQPSAAAEPGAGAEPATAANPTAAETAHSEARGLPQLLTAAEEVTSRLAAATRR